MSEDGHDPAHADGSPAADPPDRNETRSAPPLLSVENLKTYFDTPAGVVKAVDDVSFHLRRSEILAIVGESGSGKSVTAQSIMKLVASPPGRYAGGRVTMDGVDLMSEKEAALGAVRGKRISMIFQNPRAALNPSFRVATTMVETLRRHDPALSRAAAGERALALLRAVDFRDPERIAASFPHQMSGGMCQRVGVALSMACEPEVLIADEPTTALDVVVQATILLLLKRAHREQGLSIILITHDFGVVRALATRVVVMYAGKVQEEGPADTVLRRPQHPYTKALIASVPDPRRTDGRLQWIGGQPPDLARPFPGCRFADRCGVAMPRCRTDPPAMHAAPTGSAVRCHLFEPARAAA